jgi:excinuclease ABC subunit C
MSDPANDPIETILEGLPARPGVYLMKDAAAKVIYVGKAANLRTRVRSYFRESGDQRFSIKFLRARVADIEVVVTDTEKEALLLENTFIKKYQPRYNIRLRDDKTYISLRLDTTQKWPRLHRIRRRRENDKAHYFGPFSSSRSVKETMRFLQKIFPLRSCPDNVLNNRTRPCILHQIERCCAPCVNLVTPDKYKEYVDQTILFLNGRRDEVVDLLKARMWEYSESMAYEKAAMVRDQLIAIQKTIEAEKVVSHRRFDRDVIGHAREQGKIVFTLLCFRTGVLAESKSFDFKDHGLPDGEILEGFLTQYYADGAAIPRDLLVSAEPADPTMLQNALEELRGGPVRILKPQRGDKVRLISMAVTNARQELEKRLAGEKSRDTVITDLQEKLKLPATPVRIECFDISNFQGSFVVGSMTTLVNGEPDKSGYRHFKIQSVTGQDDFASMREVLTRRYSRVLREGGTLPDLIVIDGGKGQLNSAVQVLRELDLLGRVPVCGLAKARLLAGRQGIRTAIRTEERVFLPNRKDPIRFDQSDPALFLLTRIRDEAHRFGISYHRKLRNSASLRTGLEELPGIGPTRRRNLITHFGSLARLKEATSEQIADVPGMNAKLAAQVFQFLHAPKASEVGGPEDGDSEFADDESVDE